MNSNNSVVLCKVCQDICPSRAIAHPSRRETVNLIRKLLRDERQRGKTIRVTTWKGFKQLLAELKPTDIVYSIDQNGTSKDKELTCLRLILPAQEAYYVYVDFPKGDRLRETKIVTHEKTVRHLEDQELMDFLKNQLQRKELGVYSY